MAGLVIIQIWPSYALASYFAKRLAVQYQEWTSVEQFADSWVVLASRTIWEKAEAEAAEKAEIAMSAVEIIRRSQTLRDIDDEHFF